MQIGPVNVTQHDAILAGGTTVVAGAGAGVGGYFVGAAKVRQDMVAAVKAARLSFGAGGVAVGAGLALGIPALIRSFD